MALTEPLPDLRSLRLVKSARERGKAANTLARVFVMRAFIP